MTSFLWLLKNFQLYKNSVFNCIPLKIENKIGVDPTQGGTHRKTSDDFFIDNTKNFDVIFIDGLHTYEQCQRDCINSLKFLNPGGILIIEDIFKYKKEHAEINYYKNLKNFIKFFTEIFFIDTEHVNNFTSNYKCEKIFVLIKKWTIILI